MKKDRQHTVPVVYLKRFSEKRKKEYYFYVYDKNNPRIYESNIKNVPIENNFYTLELTGENYAWEDFYAEQIEPLLGTTITEFVERCEIPLFSKYAKVLTKDIKELLAELMIYQLYRGRSARAYEELLTEELFPEVLQKMKKEFQERGDIKHLEELSAFSPQEDLKKQIYADVSTNPSRIHNIAQCLLKKCWIAYRIIGDGCFITSDNPVMIINEIEKKYKPFHSGLANNLTVVYYPISSKIMIAIYSNNIFMGTMTKYSDRVLNLEYNKEKDFIDTINSFQIKQCERQAFSQSNDCLKSAVGKL